MWLSKALKSTLNLEDQFLQKISHFSIDSRDVIPGTCFFALRGQKVNGRDFLKEVESKGALFALVDQKVNETFETLKLIHVKDVKETLQKLAQKSIEYWQPKVIAITGSLGKSSTKEFLYTLCSNSLSIIKNQRSYNSQLMLPITILNSPYKSKYLILEMGMDQKNELDRLINIAPPTYSILTTIDYVHVEPFKTLSRLADEKFKIFKHSKTEYGLYNLDMPHANKIRAFSKLKTNSYSLKDPAADYYIQQEARSCSVFYKHKTLFAFKNPLPGPKNLYNFLAAIAMAHHLGVSIAEIQAQLPKIEFIEGRMQKKEQHGICFINDSYNSSVASVENALLSLESYNGRKIAILGPIVDQGDYCKKNHQLVAQMALDHVDCLIGYGSDMQPMRNVCKNSKKKWAFFLNFDNMMLYVNRLLKNGDTVLVKGSRKYALERVIDDFNPN